MKPQYRVTGDLNVTRMEIIRRREKNQSASAVQLRVKKKKRTRNTLICSSVGTVDCYNNG